ncbi:MAG TPA: 16S rRNA (cytidine(1402)-2'-O)-methyltransferase [Polyangiaceae bacterium]|nr:16S rRNA (cytidine(1402)-2'-O)-methyltransferase [Polyangiaceae bacterium]
MPGRLFLIGTPIGNLGDITLRAVETLKQVDCVLAEDTRRSRVLLSHLGITAKRLLALHAHSGERALSAAVERLQAGESLALLTDAGMPSVSDPGTDLVRVAREAGAEIVVVPGPSAVTSAVALSGLVDGPFTFLGFLPRKGTNRADALSWLAKSSHPVLLFESPHRVAETLADLLEYCGPRRVAICRELTKKFEETLLTTLDDAARPDFKTEWLGELTLVVDGRAAAPEDDTPYDFEGRARELLAHGHSARETTDLVLAELSSRGQRASRREIYQGVLALDAPREV